MKDNAKIKKNLKNKSIEKEPTKKPFNKDNNKIKEINERANGINNNIVKDTGFERQIKSLIQKKTKNQMIITHNDEFYNIQVPESSFHQENIMENTETNQNLDKPHNSAKETNQFKLKMKKNRILIMDDEEPVRKILQRYLSKKEYSVELAKNGEEAIRIFKKRKLEKASFDLVILDWYIKNDMNGGETLKKLREIDKNVKALLISGYPIMDSIENIKNMGFYDFLPKPFNMDELFKRIKKIL
ncbi:MAG: response regulator [Promethearchaeota archaeon]